MKNRKFEVPFYSFYDVVGMKKHLEDMAAKGWFVDKISNFGWHYHREEPKEVQYNVSYYARSSIFDPEISEEQKDFRDFCEYSGWTVVAENAQFLVFYNPDKDAVPIYTDPDTEIDAIEEVEKRNLLSYVVLMVITVLNLIMQISRIRFQGVIALADSVGLSTTFMVMVITLFFVADMNWYFRWKKKAREFADTGEFLSTQSPFVGFLKFIVPLCLLNFLFAILISKADSQKQIIILTLVVDAIMIFIINAVRTGLKKKKVSAMKNRIVTFCVSVVLIMVNVGLITFTGISLAGNNDRYSQDENMLTIKMLTGKKEDQTVSHYGDSSLLLSYTSFHESADLEGETVSPYLFYEIGKTKFAHIKNMVLKHYIEDYESRESYRDGYDPEHPFYDFREVKENGWNTDNVLQLYHNDVAQNCYILIYDSCVVRLECGWKLTDDQKQICGDYFGDSIK